MNTFQWYQKRVYKVEETPDYAPDDELWAYRKAREWGERIPLGLIYRRPRPVLEEAYPLLAAGALSRQAPKRPLEQLLADFY